MLITFIKDATLSDEPTPGPHYRRGAVFDVTPQIAQGWIARGVAVAGSVQLEDESPAVEPLADQQADRTGLRPFWPSSESSSNEPDGDA